MIIVRVSARSRRGESVKIKVAVKKMSNETSWTRTRRVLLGSSESARDNDSCSPPLSAADRSGSSWINPKTISPSNGNCKAFRLSCTERSVSPSRHHKQTRPAAVAAKTASAQ